jgi:hypothetical protein
MITLKALSGTRLQATVFGQYFHRRARTAKSLRVFGDALHHNDSTLAGLHAEVDGTTLDRLVVIW